MNQIFQNFVSILNPYVVKLSFTNNTTEKSQQQPAARALKNSPTKCDQIFKYVLHEVQSSQEMITSFQFSNP